MPETAGPISIGAPVDLELAPDAGGHVKSRERFAEAAGYHAAPASGSFDLTVYFLQPDGAINPAGSKAGPETESMQAVAPHVRIETVPAVSGTRRRDLVQGTGHTDLARFRPALVGSLHTDVPAFAGFYAPDVVARMLGGSRTVRRLSRLAGTGLLGRRLTRRRVGRVFGACRRLLAAAPADRAAPARRYPQTAVGPLGRGIGLRRFGPIFNDRYFTM